MAAALHLRRFLREHWRDLRNGSPGQRFQDRYRRVRRSGRPLGAGTRFLFLIAALVCLLIALVLMFFPGPAIPFFFAAGGLLATESRAVAKLMDWSEVKIRKLLAAGRSAWRLLPGSARVLVLLLFACGSAGTAYLGLKLLQR